MNYKNNKKLQIYLDNYSNPGKIKSLNKIYGGARANSAYSGLIQTKTNPHYQVSSRIYSNTSSNNIQRSYNENRQNLSLTLPQVLKEYNQFSKTQNFINLTDTKGISIQDYSMLRYII